MFEDDLCEKIDFNCEGEGLFVLDELLIFFLYFL